MDTPSFSRSEDREMGFSLGDMHQRALAMEEQKEEKSNEQMVDKTTQTDYITAVDCIADMAERLLNIEASLNNHLAIILDANETQFRKIMEGFRAIQKCWTMSAEATIEMGDAVDQFKQLTGLP